VIEKQFIVATAGHVDHGKSTLVKALTGVDPDRLPEEKSRGITIELGFAELNLAGPGGEQFHLGIVDVPGHEDFVRNMIAGVGSIDLALLVVAADDGWMPQTEEHLQILTYLGVKRAVVALTKSDIADPAKAEAEIRDQLRGSAFADSPIIRTSFSYLNLTGLTGQVPQETIALLKTALTTELSQLQPQRDIGKPRLFVDRAFTLRGIGTVVTGTLTGGTLSRGETVTIQPKNITARIRSIQSHGREIETACPGSRTALNLADVGIGFGQNTVARGDVIAPPDLGPTADVLNVLIDRSARLKRDVSTAKPIKNRSSVYIHHGTARTVAKIVLSDKDALNSGESETAELRLASPLFAFVGDRFVLRDPSERYTIAGGVVLNVRHDVAKKPDRELFRKLAMSPDAVELFVLSEVTRAGTVETSNLLRQSNFSAEEVAVAVERLSKAGAIFVGNGIATDAGAWQALTDRARNLIDRFHANTPDQRGIELSDLRVSLDKPELNLFETVVQALCENGFVRHGSRIARRNYRTELPVEIRSAAEEIRARLAAKPFDPPSRNEIVKVPHGQQALRFLLEQDEAISLGDDVVLLKDASARMQKIVTHFIATKGPATASQLRQTLGSSRRVVIPFLEHLDRMGVTQRVGDSRRLRQNKTEAVAQK
jgi:selenocysteine-specific elongation factor